MLQAPSSSVRPDLERIVAQKFAPRRLLAFGIDRAFLSQHFSEKVLQPIICTSESELNSALAQNGRAERFDLAIWFYPDELAEIEDRIVPILARVADDIVLLPAPGVQASKARPGLVDRFGRYDLAPDYDCDLHELGTGAVCLTRHSMERGPSIVPAVESAFARLNRQVHGLERKLHTRMSELEAADRHIVRLEEKILKLRAAKQQLKQLKEEKHALRKSPERKVGQVLLAPYRLPQKLIRKVRKQIRAPVPASPSKYQAWLDRHRVTGEQAAGLREEARKFSEQPLVSIITPVFDTPVSWLEEAVASVLNQIYPKWELILIDDASTDPETLAGLTRLAASDPRIRLLRRENRGGISAASNEGIAQARGEWIALLDHDDLLEPDAVFEVVRVLQQNPEADLIYSDEDKLTENGFDVPSLKPDWSPDFFLSYNYICHFAALRRSIVNEAGGFRPEFDGAQDYDLFLRVSERTDRIHHIPRVLYHWRRSETSTAENIWRKPKALEAGRCAIEEHLERRGEESHVAIDWNTHAYWVKREIAHPKRVSIIIPVRDRIDLLARCVESLTTKTRYQNYEIVIVNNESQSGEARQYFSKTKHRVLQFNGPFNFSALNNFAVGQTDNPWLLLLNSDVEIIEGEWLSLMAEHIQRPEVGAVGARLLYPDNTIQHAGVVLGVAGPADHAFRGLPAEHPGVNRQLQVIRNYSAVTGACLLTRREVFDKVGGFDQERLPVTYNDVDLCLKMRRAGYLIVYTPFARLYHHESASRRSAVEPIDAEVIYERWPDILKHDPYYNPNLSRERADFSLGK